MRFERDQFALRLWFDLKLISPFPASEVREYCEASFCLQPVAGMLSTPIGSPPFAAACSGVITIGKDWAGFRNDMDGLAAILGPRRIEIGVFGSTRLSIGSSGAMDVSGRYKFKRHSSGQAVYDILFYHPFGPRKLEKDKLSVPSEKVKPLSRRPVEVACLELVDVGNHVVPGTAQSLAVPIEIKRQLQNISCRTAFAAIPLFNDEDWMRFIQMGETLLPIYSPRLMSIYRGTIVELNLRDKDSLSPKVFEGIYKLDKERGEYRGEFRDNSAQGFDYDDLILRRVVPV